MRPQLYEKMKPKSSHLCTFHLLSLVQILYLTFGLYMSKGFSLRGCLFLYFKTFSLELEWSFQFLLLGDKICVGIMYLINFLTLNLCFFFLPMKVWWQCFIYLAMFHIFYAPWKQIPTFIFFGKVTMYF